MNRPADDIQLDPRIAAELDALEAALAGTPGADPQLSAIVRDVRAAAAPMPLALRTRLDARVAAGFPRSPSRRPAWTTPRRLLPVLGVAAAVIVALVVAGGALRPERSTAPSSLPSLSSGGITADSSADSAATTQSRESTAIAPQADLAAPARKVERSVELDLRVARDHLQETADGVVRTTQAVSGYVADSQVSARGTGGSATFTLRIPTARLDDATARLSRLGHVARLEQGSHDITGSVASAAGRLQDARAERRALLRALGRATTPAAIASLKARIADNRSEIARLQGDVTALRRRADNATVAVTVTADRGAAVAAPADRRWSPGDAAGDALRVLEVAAGVTIVALAALLPIAVVAVLALLAARVMRRRRREHALDAA